MGACRPSPDRRGRRPPVEPRHVAPPQGAVPVMVWTAIVAQILTQRAHRPGSRPPCAAGTSYPDRVARPPPGPPNRVPIGSRRTQTVSDRRILQMVRSGHSGSNTPDVRLKPDIQAKLAGVAGRGRRDRAGPVRGTRVTADAVRGRGVVPGQPEDRHEVGTRRQAHCDPDPGRTPSVPGLGDPALPRGDEHGRALTGDTSSEPQGVFAHAAVEGFEQVAFCHDAATGLRAIIAIHSTVLGPALGGTRFRPYATEADAVADVCRLARGMTYKHAVSGLDCGGGKAVILGDPRTLRSEPLLRAYARFIDGLAGRYLTAEDVGTTQADMDLIRRETPYVTGVSESLGGSGDPVAGDRLGGAGGPAHRRPARLGRAVARPAATSWSSASARSGRALVDHLVDEGARVTVADVDPGGDRGGGRGATAWRRSTRPTPTRSSATCSRPCALGGVLNARTIPELRCAAVCGSANNQLETPADGQRLAERGVLFAPDYVVNAGGVINIAEERTGPATTAPGPGPASPASRPPWPPCSTGPTPTACTPRGRGRPRRREPHRGDGRRPAHPHVPARTDGLTHPSSRGGTSLARTLHAPTGEDLSALHLHDRHTELGLERPTTCVAMYRRILLARLLDQKIWAPQPDGQGPVRRQRPGPRGRAGRVGLGAPPGPRRRPPLLPRHRRPAHPGHDRRGGPARRCSPAPPTPSSGGRQMPNHWGSRPAQRHHRLVADRHAAPARGRPRLRRQDPRRGPVVVSYFGEGATSKGDFHEALNFAGIHQLPCVFVCENNGYAISVPLTKESAVDDVADRAHSYGFGGVIVDGNDPLDVYAATHAGGAPGPAGRGADAGRVQDVPLHGPHVRRRRPHLPHEPRRSRPGGRRTRSGR